MIKYLSTNSKLKKSGIFSWGIPAYKSESGMLTCPAAQSCIKGCYARNGSYRLSVVKKAKERNLALSLTDSFVDTIDNEIKLRKVIKLRVHDSGDFYSIKYLNDWATIASRNPQTLFYAYTKMLPILPRVTLPGNFVIIKSYGGKFDSLINPETDRHSMVFSSKEKMIASGYADTTETDDNAFNPNVNKVGLVYHGLKPFSWNTEGKNDGTI